MYAVIATGGGQEKVEQGQVVRIDSLAVAEGDEVSFRPVLLVDGDTVLATPAELGASSVTARVVGSERGAKITGFTYKPKTNSRRRWGHRQAYTTVEITDISKG